MFKSFRNALQDFSKRVETRLAPKEVLNEVILQPSRIENDGERIVAQVCRGADGELYLIFRGEDNGGDETRLGVRVTKDALSRLRELMTVTESSFAELRPPVDDAAPVSSDHTP